MKEEMKEVCEFFDKYGVEYEIKNGKVVCNRFVNLSGITDEDFALPKGFEKVIFKGDVYLRGTNIKSLPEGFKCGGCVYLKNTNIESLPKDFKCGGNVDLVKTKIESLPENFKCGGSVDLYDTNIKSLPEGFKCGGCVFLPGAMSMYGNNFQEGEETEEYIYCDNILTFIQSKKQMGEYTVYKDVFGEYLVRAKDYNAHGSSIKQCISDINYKRSDRDASKYKGIDRDKQLPLDELIVMYRVITGACSQGVQDFINNNCENEEYSINELKELTIGNYGHSEFLEFFK